MTAEDRLKICRGCSYYGGDQYVNAQAATSHCKAKGSSPGCINCRVHLRAETTEGACTLGYWGKLPEPEPLEIPQIIQSNRRISDPDCRHFLPVLDKNWGNCGISHIMRPHKDACSKCEKRQPK